MIKHHSPYLKPITKLGCRHANSTFKVHKLVEIKLLTRLRLGLSHLIERKCGHNFAYYMSPLCSCSIKSESRLFSRLFSSCKVSKYVYKL